MKSHRNAPICCHFRDGCLLFARDIVFDEFKRNPRQKNEETSVLAKTKRAHNIVIVHFPKYYGISTRLKFNDKYWRLFYLASSVRLHGFQTRGFSWIFHTILIAKRSLLVTFSRIRLLNGDTPDESPNENLLFWALIFWIKQVHAQLYTGARNTSTNSVLTPRGPAETSNTFTIIIVCGKTVLKILLCAKIIGVNWELPGIHLIISMIFLDKIWYFHFSNLICDRIKIVLSNKFSKFVVTDVQSLIRTNYISTWIAFLDVNQFIIGNLGIWNV